MAKQPDPEGEEEAIRLKAMAEKNFKDSNLKSAVKHAKKAHRLRPDLVGISSMLTAFKILRVACKTPRSGITDWYKILQVEPFSHINSIKKQYKKLALVLHPDKNPHLGCEEAFKLVGEGFRVLSDKIRRKDYDLRLRIKIQDEKVSENAVVDTFWTACSRCRLLHQFERKYLGHNLMCPSCKKSFEAVEVEEEKKGEDDGVRVRVRSKRMRRKVVGERFGNFGLQPKMGSTENGAGGVDSEREKGGANKGKVSDVGRKTVGSATVEWKEGNAGRRGGGRLKSIGQKRNISLVVERSKSKKVKFDEETMTLAEMQVEARKKGNKEKEKLKENPTEVVENEDKSEHGVLKKLRDSQAEKNGGLKMSGNEGTKARSQRHGTSKKSLKLEIEKRRDSRSGDMEIMAVEDSDFYDFDGDRVERSFKKGQIWAIYDDSDGMPRHYGLIDEVVSVNPFVVKLSWLDLQSNGDQGLICWEKMGFHVSCGRFKVSGKTTVNSLGIFSHLMDCERAAKEVYRIYPKKGSVWALYKESYLSSEQRNTSDSDEKCYDIVLSLTTYSEVHGLSMAYLEKVDGFKTVFKRREIGSHAIRWLEKGDMRVFSHQIPARKLSGDEVPDIIKNCWELDPASLPSNLLTIG